jgi:hypothetical protein
MQKTVVSSVINEPISAIAELSAIVKIHKYRGLHEVHHFYLMAMEVHNTLGHDIDCVIKECACLFHDRQSGGHLSLSFCIQFFKHRVSIVFHPALASAIERKIALMGNVCFRPPNTIRSHDLHVGDIRRAVGEITSYHKKVCINRK